MSRVLRTIDCNVEGGIQTPEKSLRKKIQHQENKSAKKYRAADLLDIALKHERSGDIQAALSAYEDAAENIANNSKILAKINILKTQIADDMQRIANEKKMAQLRVQQEEEARRLEEENQRPQADQDDYYESGADVSVMTEDNAGDMFDDITESGTLYSEYDPVKRAEILKQLQSRTLSALEYQLLDRLNKGDRDELLQLKQIGNVRACGIMELREQHSVSAENESGDGLYFKSLDQLEDIFMKPKEIKNFLKQNATFLLGL